MPSPRPPPSDLPLPLVSVRLGGHTSSKEGSFKAERKALVPKRAAGRVSSPLPEVTPVLAQEGSQKGGGCQEWKAVRWRVLGAPLAVFSGSVYCLVSMGMTLGNKTVLSSFGETSANAILVWQCTVGMLCVLAGWAGGVFKIEPLTLPLLRIWLPVSFIFVGMIATSFWALQALNVGIVTVLKVSITNVLVLGGDFFLYGRRYSRGVWGSLGLLVVSALCGAATDLTFDARGYAWQGVNCGCTAAYSLYLRGAMDRVKAVTQSGGALGEASMVLYNNLFSVPLLLALMAWQGELQTLLRQALTPPPGIPPQGPLSCLAHHLAGLGLPFLAALTISGLLASALGLTVVWFLGTTTPSVFSLVGSLNKAPTALLGMLLFRTPTTPQSLLSILLGLVAGVVFVLAKSRGGVMVGAEGGSAGVGSGGG